MKREPIDEVAISFANTHDKHMVASPLFPHFQNRIPLYVTTFGTTQHILQGQEDGKEEQPLLRSAGNITGGCGFI